VRRGARRADPVGERGDGHVRPVDPRRLHGYRVQRCRARHRPQAADAALGARAVPGSLAEMRALVLAASLALAACSGSSAPDIDTSTYGAGDDWNNPGGDCAESHFSRLTDI